MALTILSSNRVEALQRQLTRQLSANPLTDPFACETVIVPTYAMARWLNIRIAEDHGIAANIAYPQLGEWIWQIAATLLEDIPAQDPYSRDLLTWQIFSQLPELLGRPAFVSLQRYLDTDTSGIQRWQLAHRVAESLDRYQTYHPQMIRAWSNGDDDHWQAQLWRHLVQQRGQPHRVGNIERLLTLLEQKSTPAELPARVSLFALSNVPPIHLEVLRVLSKRIDIHLYLHSPTDQYWADLETQKQLARRRLEQPEIEVIFSDGNDLMAAWGRQGQVLQDLLLQQLDTAIIDREQFQTPSDSTLLTALQRSIFNLEALPQSVAADDSIAVHRCHSPMRECQVLLDEVLSMLAADDSLMPEDILVMVPDIKAYAPYIEAVFQRQRFGFNISDTTLAAQHPLVTTFLQLLNLPRSRFTSNEILGLLDNPALCRRFELNSGDLLEIRRLIQQAHVRWGIDAWHKTDFDLPPTEGNTWAQASERFFAGFALADDDLWQGVAPLPGWDETSADAIGKFLHLLDRLRHWRQRLNESRDAGSWQQLLNHLLEDFFTEADARESRLQLVREAVSEIRSGSDVSISPQLLTYLLQTMLGSGEQSGQLYSGGITFCGMRPMRSIPFRVICIVGMNYEDFPRRDPPGDLEVMPRGQTATDPSRRSEDRYLMLETLLCARDRLYFSYTGRSLKDNSPKPPSAVLQELLDFIDGNTAGDAVSVRKTALLTHEHSLQAFAASAFSGANACFDRYWCQVARQLNQAPGELNPVWPTVPLPDSNKAGLIDLAQLQQFLRHPVQYFFRQRLGLKLESEELPDDDENFEVGPLLQWSLKQELARATLEQRDDSDERLLASGMLGHGFAARHQIEQLRQQNADWLERLRDYAERETHPLSLSISIDADTELRGSVNNYYAERGLMAYHPGKFKGNQLLQLWVAHLALCAGYPAAGECNSLLLASDRAWRLGPVDKTQALEKLRDYCALYLEGLDYPLPVFPDTSYAWATEPDPAKAYAKAMRLWQNQWTGAYGDRGDPYLGLVLQQLQRLPLNEDAFDSVARRLYTDLIEQAESL